MYSVSKPWTLLALLIVPLLGAAVAMPKEDTSGIVYFQTLIGDLVTEDAEYLPDILRLLQRDHESNYKMALLTEFYDAIKALHHTDNPVIAMSLYDECQSMITPDTKPEQMQVLEVMKDELSHAIIEKGADMLQAIVLLGENYEETDSSKLFTDQLYEFQNHTILSATFERMVEKIYGMIPTSTLIPSLSLFSTYVPHTVDTMLALYKRQRPVGEDLTDFMRILHELRKQEGYEHTVTEEKKRQVSDIIRGPMKQIIDSEVCLHQRMSNGSRLYLHKCQKSNRACVSLFPHIEHRTSLLMKFVGEDLFIFKQGIIDMYALYADEKQVMLTKDYDSIEDAGGVKWGLTIVDGDRVMLQEQNNDQYLCGSFNRRTGSGDEWYAYFRTESLLPGNDCKWYVDSCKGLKLTSSQAKIMIKQEAKDLLKALVDVKPTQHQKNQILLLQRFPEFADAISPENQKKLKEISEIKIEEGKEEVKKALEKKCTCETEDLEEDKKNAKKFSTLLPTVAAVFPLVTGISRITASFIISPIEDTILIPDELDNCPVGFFHCNTSTQCVPQRLNCDGAADCDDASDEWNCVNDVDAKFWDHLFRKQPFGRHDDLAIEACSWPISNMSCLCRGNEILCRFQQLSALPANLPAQEVAMLDLTGNSFPNISEDFFKELPSVESLVLKFCSIEVIATFAFKRLAEIPLKTLYLDENKISSLPQNLFPPQNYLRILILSGNRINVLHDYDFTHLDKLEELDLRGNHIMSFESSVFSPLINLEMLYLNENRIRHLHPGMFPQLWNLHTLSLAHNHIATIEKNSFTFPRLGHLFLAGNRLTELKERTFCSLHLLQGLHLNDNQLNSFDFKAFACLENLTSLLLTGNPFQSLDARVLQNLTHLNYVYFSWFHLCRAALHVRVCEPRGDGISSTYHLLDNQILRGSVWIMATVAVLGNLTVWLGRYFYKSRSNVEHSMYLRHLAASDFLMGVYLTIIASADISYRGKYIVHEEAWRHSAVCAFSGFLNTFSCQSSTLLLTLVTWDRLMSVTRPLQPRDMGRTRIALRLSLLWGISFALAAAPLFPSDYFGQHFYGNNGVCLSLHIHDPYAKGWEYSALLFICINTFSLLFILVSYVRMLQAIRDSGGGMRSTISGRESVVATRFAVIVSTDCACWLPIIVVKLAALSGCVVSPALYAWLAVLVLPVNSALNPVLYTLTTAAFKQQLRRLCLTLPSCSNQEPRSQTQTAFESGLSMSLAHFGSNNASGRKRFLQNRMSFV